MKASKRRFMGQVAYEATSRRRIEAFDLSDAEWDAVSSLPKGALVMPVTDWPAVPKTSIRGLRFFAHHAGYPHKLPAPESYAHTRLKIDVVRALRALDYEADLEVRGSTPSGEEWIADVLAKDNLGMPVAFEIQFSSQHLDDFRARSQRYEKSSVRVCWIMPEKPVAWRLQKAIIYENADYYRATKVMISDIEEVVPFTVDIVGKDQYPDPLPPVRFGRGHNHMRLSLSEAVEGMMSGRPTWAAPDWLWHDPERTG